MTLRETEVVTGAGPDAYAAPPFLPPSKEGEQATSLVPPAPAAPPRVVSPAEAEGIGQAVAAYCTFGFVAMLKKHPELAADLNGFLVAQGMEGGLNGAAPKVHGFVAGCATRTCLKWNIMLPYLDEGVTVLAIGFASYGLFGKVKNDNKKKPDDDSREARGATGSHKPGERGATPRPATPASRLPDEDELDGLDEKAATVKPSEGSVKL